MRETAGLLVVYGITAIVAFAGNVWFCLFFIPFFGLMHLTRRRPANPFPGSEP